MISDNLHCARIATRPTGAVLQEVGIRNLLMRSLPAPFLLAVAGLVSAGFLSFNFHAITASAAPWWQVVLGLLMLAILAGGLIVYPIWWAAELVGQRYEYVFDRSQRQLWARSRWFGVVLRSRRYGFDQFQRVSVRLELSPGAGFAPGSWEFVVSCEGEGVSLRLVCCFKRQRAVELAGAIAAQIALPVQDQTDDKGRPTGASS